MEDIQEGKNTRYVTGVTSYNINCNDDFINIDTTANAVAVYLPNINGSGLLGQTKTFIISDYRSNAGANNITIYSIGNDTVNQVASVVIAVNGGVAQITVSGPNQYLVDGKLTGAAGGTITGGGTANFIPIFTTATAIGDSVMSQTGSNVGISTAIATARLHLPAGTTSASSAPLKFTSGALNTSPEAGAIEFLTDKLYFTITTSSARKEITINDTTLVSGRVPFVTTNGRLTSVSNFTYVSGGALRIFATGTNSVILNPNFTSVGSCIHLGQSSADTTNWSIGADETYTWINANTANSGGVRILTDNSTVNADFLSTVLNIYTPTLIGTLGDIIPSNNLLYLKGLDALSTSLSIQTVNSSSQAGLQITNNNKLFFATDYTTWDGYSLADFSGGTGYVRYNNLGFQIEDPIYGSWRLYAAGTGGQSTFNVLHNGVGLIALFNDIGLGIGLAAGPTASLQIKVSTGGYAQINLTPDGTSPFSPNKGDIWFIDKNLYFQRDSLITDTIITGQSSTGNTFTGISLTDCVTVNIGGVDYNLAIAT